MVTTLISPCGILGYGFPAASLEKALEQSPDAIVVDAGSTDAGPHKLGAGTAIVSRMAAKKDLSLLMAGARRLQIPLVIGSAGGSGARKHTLWTLDIIKEIARETGWNPRLMVIWADIPNEAILSAMEEGRVTPMSPNAAGLARRRLRPITYSQ